MVSYCSSSISKTLSLTIFAQLTIRHRQTDSRISMAMTTLMLCIGRKNPMLYRPIGLPSLPVSCAVDAYMLLSLPECEGDFLVTGQLHPHWNGVNPNFSPHPTAVPADGCIVACNSFEMPASVPPQSRSRRKLRFLEAEKIVCGTELGLRLPSALCPPSDRKNFEGYRVGCWVYRPPSDRQHIF
jgi:hypothetical protein